MKEDFKKYLRRADLGLLAVRGTAVSYFLVVQSNAVACGLRWYY